MRFRKITHANRGARLYYRGIALSAAGVLLFLTGLLQLSGLADFGAGGMAMAVLAISGAGLVMIGFGTMTAACCGLELAEGEMASPQSAELAPAAGYAEARIIKVRCRTCRALNDELATICEECGQAV